jgi:hypothetical protein
MLGRELVPKRLELLHEMVPSAAVLGFLANTHNPNTPADIKDVQEAADSVGRKLLVVHAGADADFDTAFAALVQGGVGALFVASDPFFNSRRDRLVALSARHAIPTIYSWREFPVAGGLNERHWHAPWIPPARACGLPNISLTAVASPANCWWADDDQSMAHAVCAYR